MILLLKIENKDTTDMNLVWITHKLSYITLNSRDFLIFFFFSHGYWRCRSDSLFYRFVLHTYIREYMNIKIYSVSSSNLWKKEWTLGSQEAVLEICSRIYWSRLACTILMYRIIESQSPSTILARTGQRYVYLSLAILSRFTYELLTSPRKTKNIDI